MKLTSLGPFPTKARLMAPISKPASSSSRSTGRSRWQLMRVQTGLPDAGFWGEAVFDEQQASCRPKYAAQLPKRATRVGDAAQRPGHHGDVNAVGGQWHRLHGRLDQIDRTAQARESSAGLGEEFRRGVDPGRGEPPGRSTAGSGPSLCRPPGPAPRQAAGGACGRQQHPGCEAPSRPGREKPSECRGSRPPIPNAVLFQV